MGIDVIIMLIMWLLQYFAAKKAGASNATAALLATGGTYALNKLGVVDKIAGAFSGGQAVTTGAVSATGGSSTGSSLLGGLAGLGGLVAPALATVAGVSAVSATSSFVKNNIGWILGGGLLFFFLRKKDNAPIVIREVRSNEPKDYASPSNKRENLL